MSVPRRIDLHDTPAKAVIRLAGDHRGAAVTLIALVKASDAVHPRSEFGPFTPLVMLDALDLPPDQVWHLFDQVAGRDSVALLTLLHAVRLGLLPARALRLAASGKARIDVAATRAKVAGEIPEFASSSP